MAGLQMKYFVLKPSGDNHYASAARVAMHAFAFVIADENPDLARDLHEWADRAATESNKDNDESKVEETAR